MIRKIVLSNFMAHVQTELELADGLNVIVGPNNIGKSSIAVALKILARNSNSNFVMQHDQKECSVTVETGDGHTVQWLKRKSPSNRINGRAKDRLGRGGTPPELDETLRLASIEFEEKDLEPHFGDQKSPIFLINRPPSQIAQFIDYFRCRKTGCNAEAPSASTKRCPNPVKARFRPQSNGSPIDRRLSHNS